MLSNTHRKGKPHQWDENKSQNITFTKEKLNNENKKLDKTHYMKEKAIVIGDSMVNNINNCGLSNQIKFW